MANENGLDFSEYARALGRIKTPKKAASSRKNMMKAQKASAQISQEARKERARKAALARWKDHTKKDDNK